MSKHTDSVEYLSVPRKAFSGLMAAAFAVGFISASVILLLLWSLV